MRAVAITKGKIADILVVQGQLDGALAMRLERLPIAQELKDIDLIAHIRFSCAQIRLHRGDHEHGGIQVLFEELSEAFRSTSSYNAPTASAPPEDSAAGSSPSAVTLTRPSMC